MKTFTSILALVGPIAGVVIPGFASAGFSLSLVALLAIAAVLMAVVAYAVWPESSVDQVRTGSSTATSYFAATPAIVSKSVPAVKAAPRIQGAVRTTRRVRAIVEIAA